VRTGEDGGGRVVRPSPSSLSVGVRFRVVVVGAPGKVRRWGRQRLPGGGGCRARRRDRGCSGVIV